MTPYPRTVTAQLLGNDGTPIGGSPLAEAFGIVFYDEWNGPGWGQVSLSLSLAGSAQLLPGRYVNCLVEGVVRFTFKIEGNPQYQVIERGEEHDQIVTVRGRGWTCIFDEAATFPEYSLTFSLETTWRLFSFASALFPNAGAWGAAVEQAEYLDGVIEAPCYGHWQMAPDGLAYPAPIGWPWGTNPFNLVDGVPTANYEDQFWLRTPDQPNYVSAGYYFFRREFTLAEFSPVTFTVTADNFMTFFLEGVPIMGEKISTADHWLWQGWHERQIWLPAGTYTVAAAVYNIAFTTMGGTPVEQPPCPAEGFAGGPRDENPGGLLAAIYIAGDVVTPPTAILMTNDTWDAHYEAEYWPGWTPWQIINQLATEGIANGALTVYNGGGGSVSATADSNGDAWRPTDTSYDRPDIPTFATEVGTSMLAALQQLHEIGWINWHGQPGTFELDVYRGRAPAAPSSSATLAHGVNLGALERNVTAPYANALLVQWEGGYTTVSDAAAITAMGTTIWATYSSDAGSEEEAVLQGDNELLRMAQTAYPAIVAVIEPRSAADCPYEAFESGDYVTTPAPGGGTELVRCLSVRCAQDALGYAQWTCELNQKLDVPERRTTQLLQQIGGRQQVIRGTVN